MVKTVALGTENALVGKGALQHLGAAAAGATKVLAVAGGKAWKAAGETAAAQLEAAGVPYALFPFSGYCSERNVSAIMDTAIANQCDMLIGFGGGKCMDSVKSAADKLDLPCILAPTSCATCASNVRLCVWYDDEGRCVPGMFARKSAHTLIVDTELIVEKGDARLMASGMMDALAKFPEIDFSMTNTPNKDRTAMLITAQRVARSNFDYILENGPAVYQDALRRECTFAAEQMVYMNIMETGLSSSLVMGVQQLAVAHMFHDAVATCFHDQRTSHLHGEMVAVGVLLQMHSNGYDAGLIKRTEAFIRSVNGPLCLSDLDIEPTEENRKIILDYIASRGYGEPELYAPIEKAFEHIYR